MAGRPYRTGRRLRNATKVPVPVVTTLDRNPLDDLEDRVVERAAGTDLGSVAELHRRPRGGDRGYRSLALSCPRISPPGFRGVACTLT
jgi:hypothetical protein